CAKRTIFWANGMCGNYSRSRGQRSEVRGQRSEVRGQRSEVRGERAEFTANGGGSKGKNDIKQWDVGGARFIVFISVMGGGHCARMSFRNAVASIPHPGGGSW